MTNQNTLDVSDAQDLWNRHSQLIDHDMAVISRFTRTFVMTKQEFLKMWDELFNTQVNQEKKQADKIT